MLTSRHPADPHSHPTALLPRSPRTVQEPSWDPADSRRSEGTHFLTGFSRANTVPRQHLRNTTSPCSKHWKKAAWLSIRSLHADLEVAFSAGYHRVFREAENKSLLTLQAPAVCFAKQQQGAQRFQSITLIFCTQPTSAAAFGAPGN